MAKKKNPQKIQSLSKPLKRKERVKIFEKTMYEFLRQIRPSCKGIHFSRDEILFMYLYRYRIPNPIATEGKMICNKELNEMGHLIHQKLREPILQHEGRWYSILELNLLFCYFQNMNRRKTKPERRYELWQYLGTSSKIDIGLDKIIDYFILLLYKTCVAASNLRSKVYLLKICSSYIDRKNPGMEFTTKLDVRYAISKKIKIDGNSRLVYRLILPELNSPWYVDFDVSEFDEKDTGGKHFLPVYIQSHALDRLKERLDLLDEEALNYSLYSNIEHFPHFYDVGEYILIPFNLFGCKIGYFACKIVNGCFIIRTFLFITHSKTSEGDKLKDICGLGWNDIPYWKIDRLSTFMNVDKEQYPHLSALFEEAGCGHVFKLHNEKFTAEAMQTANLDGLKEFIRKGQELVEEEIL